VTQAPLGLHRFAKFTAGSAFLLLIAGGLVTSTNSGLAVPDWPLAFGQYFPRMVGGVLFEHGHRMIAGSVGLLTFALTGWILLREERGWVKRVAVVAAAGIILQAALGAITVLYSLPPQISISHACLGQALFCLLIVLAQVTSPQWITYGDGATLPAQLWKSGAWLIGAIYAQLVFGALLRHTGQGLILHLLGAAAVTVVLLRTAIMVFSKHSTETVLVRPMAALSGLLLMQIFLGIFSYFVLAKQAAEPGFWASSLPTAHLAVGALILGISVLWTLRAFRMGQT